MTGLESTASPAAEGVDHGRLLIELEREHGQAIFGFARRLGLAEVEANDVVQEAFLRLWRHVAAGRPMANPKGWTYTTAYRLAMDVHRRSKRQRLVVELDAEGVTAVDDHERVAVWAAVDELPPRQREVIYLRYRSDLSFDEIGHVLGITAGAARSHATQAMGSLRRTFRDEEVG